MSLLDTVLLTTKAAHLARDADMDGHAVDAGHDWPGNAAGSEEAAAAALRKAEAAVRREAEIYERRAARHRRMAAAEQADRGALT